MSRQVCRLSALIIFISLVTTACTPQAPIVSTLAGSSRGFADGKGKTAQFNNPLDVALGPDGNLYVADSANHRIRRVTADGSTITLAGSDEMGYLDGQAEAAQMSEPTGIAANDQGLIAFADSMEVDPHPMYVRLVSADGMVTTLAGGSTAGNNDGQGIQAFFRTPASLAVDAGGNIYVADTNNHRIRKVTPDGMVTTFAGTSARTVEAGYVDGPAADARFNRPTGIAVDAAGNVYVADSNNHCIRKITPDGTVSTLAGAPTPGYVDGKAADARFNYPTDVAVDRNGNLYVADSANQRIRRIAVNGKVSTLAGTGQPGYADGPAAQAEFNLPQGIDVSDDGIVYIADSGNNKIRMIKP